MKVGDRLLIDQEDIEKEGQYLTYKGGEDWLPGRFEEGDEFVVVEVVRVVKCARVLVDVAPKPADVPEVPEPEVVG